MLKDIGEVISEKATEGIMDKINPFNGLELDTEGMKKDAIPLVLMVVLIFFAIKG